MAEAKQEKPEGRTQRGRREVLRKGRALPRGVTIKAGRFAAGLSWDGEALHLGLFGTLAEAVAARFAAEQARGWPGAWPDRGKTLEQRQSEAEARWSAEPVTDPLERSQAAHRASVRRQIGWCARHAVALPKGSRRPSDCPDCGPYADPAVYKAERARQRPSERPHSGLTGRGRVSGPERP